MLAVAIVLFLVDFKASANVLVEVATINVAIC